MPTYLGKDIIDVAGLGNLPVSNLVLGEATIPKSGLFAYYDASDPISWPGSGTTWFDISGNGLNLTTVSSSAFPTYDSTNIAFNFNGSSNALFSTKSTTTLTFNQTQVIWVKPGRTGAVDNGIYAGIQNQSGGGVSGRWDGEGYGNQGTGWTLASSNADRAVSSNVTSSIAEFVMITAVRDATNFRIYLNGATQIGATAHSLVDYSAGAYTYVGSNFLNNSTGVWGTAWFTGSLASLAYYNRALTTNEINQIYQLGR
jgi:hypothetical protein